MADMLTLLGLALNFVGALLLACFRFPALDVTADGRNVLQWHNEPTPAERSRNLRRYWRNEIATRAGLICFCVGFAFQLLGFVYPVADSEDTGTVNSWRFSASVMPKAAPMEAVHIVSGPSSRSPGTVEKLCVPFLP